MQVSHVVNSSARDQRHFKKVNLFMKLKLILATLGLRLCTGQWLVYYRPGTLCQVPKINNQE